MRSNDTINSNGRTLTAQGGRYTMSGPTGTHSLLIAETSDERLLAHWVTFGGEAAALDTTPVKVSVKRGGRPGEWDAYFGSLYAGTLFSSAAYREDNYCANEIDAAWNFVSAGGLGLDIDGCETKRDMVAMLKQAALFVGQATVAAVIAEHGVSNGAW